MHFSARGGIQQEKQACRIPDLTGNY